VGEKQVVVGEYGNEIEAEIAKEHLESSGVTASIIIDCRSWAQAAPL
jgi:hypothetical protein